MTDQLKYGNWIRKKILFWLGTGTFVMALLALLPVAPVLRWCAAALAFALFVSFLIPFYAYRAFSPRAGNFQDKFYTLIIQHLFAASIGNVLDVGTGNGILAIRLARQFLTASVTGLDYWGKDWEYSKQVCEENAALAKVSDRTTFIQGNAAALRFQEASFDAVVSNLTFHEVKSVPDKKDVVKEALRILKSGGSFAFIDYFYNPREYGPIQEFNAFLESLNLAAIELKPISEVLTLPFLLRHPKIFGKVGILYGRK